MREMLLYPIGISKACSYAADNLKLSKIKLTDHPAPEVTALLLDIPSFTSDGTLHNGQSIVDILSMLPPDLTIIGGNLSHSALNEYHTIDLLQDEAYLAQNAAITADCALRVAARSLPVTFSEAHALVIGWGRIGKCLSLLLRSVGTEVTVAARKEADLAMIHALGFHSCRIDADTPLSAEYHLIFNTVPKKILPKASMMLCTHAVKIDLASIQGIEGDDVIWARGLPGKLAPESSGRLIARTILRSIKEASI